MKQKILYTLIVVGLTACNHNPKKELVQKTIPQEQSKQKVLFLDLDKASQFNETSEQLRGNKNNLLDDPIYIGDNDEVIFVGKLLEKNSPLKIKIGDNDEVSFSGNHYKIKTLQLQTGNIIQMTDKRGKLFLEMEVIR